MPKIINRTREALLTQERLKELLHYDPDTGIFTWRQDRRGWIKAGDTAGVVMHAGHIRISVDGEKFAAHRLAFFYMTGRWPTELVDHRDNDPGNNRWSNLRESTDAQNAQNSRKGKNSTTPYKGVRLKGKRWRAMISWKDTSTGKSLRKHLGVFDTAEEAHDAYCEAGREVHGEFFRAA